MSSLLIISGHPDMRSSLANRTILEELQKTDLPCDIRRLDLSGFDLDVEEEQKHLKEAKVVVFQFPFYWYSCTALLRNWMEKVLTHGFAYGTSGKALEGKKFILSFTIGGGKEDYTHEGQHRHPIEEFLYTFQQTAALCSMDYEKPVYTFGCMYIPGVNTEEDREKVVQACRSHAARLTEEIRTFL